MVNINRAPWAPMKPGWVVAGIAGPNLVLQQELLLALEHELEPVLGELVPRRHVEPRKIEG